MDGNDSGNVGSVSFRGFVTSACELMVASQLFRKQGIKASHFWCSCEENQVTVKVS